VKIYGFGISSAQFPVDENLPKNVLLMQHDITIPLREKHYEKYDFVHVRDLVSVLGDDQWKGVVEHLEKSLSAFLRV
jgi:hypothetical protein